MGQVWLGRPRRRSGWGDSRGTGKIKELRWATAGTVVSGVVRLRHLYPGAKDIEAVITVKGENLGWPVSGGRDPETLVTGGPYATRVEN